ncbi:MAG: NADP-dependent oxidoreductase [Janthinobacterium lividum]
MTTATAIVATAFGGPEVLAVVEKDVAAPGPAEVTIEVRAVGTNPVDYKLFSGYMGADESTLPQPVGFELAGVVTAAGADAGFAVGDEVIAFRVTGAYASAITVPASDVFAKPSSVSFETASGLLLVGTTAAHLLEAGKVVAGETVLIHGVAGSVGLVAAQLAVQAGATVIGSAAEHRHAALTEMGVVPVTYGEGLADRVRAAAPQGIDAAMDTVGTDEAVDVSWELLDESGASRDRLVSVAAFARAGDGVKLLGGGPGADAGTEFRDAARAGLVEALGAGRIELPVTKTFPLTEAAAALTFLAEGHAGGKVVLIP